MTVKRRMRGALGLATAMLLAGSCQKSQGLPPVMSFEAVQRAVYGMAPADTVGGGVIADLGQVLGRLRAFRAVLDSGPVTRTYVARGVAMATEALGFDPLDAEGWKKVGVDPTGPVALFIGPKKSAQVLFRASDAARAKETAMAWYQRGGATEPFECATAGAYLHCGTPAWSLAADPASSLWPHVEKNVAPQTRAMEILVYAPLDQGEAQEALVAAKSPVKGLHAGYFGMTITPERLVTRMGARLDEAVLALPFLKARPGESLLGLAAGGVSGGRITFSPDALWALAKEKLGADLQVATGAVQGATGIELEKDVVDNLTGEIVVAGYRSAQRTDGKGQLRTYTDRLGSAALVGTRDDVRTRKLANRLGEMLGGVVGTFGETAKGFGMTPAYRSDAGDRPVHWFSFEFDAERQKILGVPRVEIFLTSLPGGLAMGMGSVGVEELRKRQGQKEAAFMSTLPLPEERMLFETSPFVFWGRAGEGFGTQMRINAATALLGGPFPDVAKVLSEIPPIAQLLFDAVAAVEVENDHVELFYQATFL